MPPVLFEKELTVPLALGAGNPLFSLERGLQSRLDPGDIPLRLALTSSSGDSCHCEVGLLSGWTETPHLRSFDTSSVRWKIPVHSTACW